MTATFRGLSTQISYVLQTLRLIWYAAQKWTLAWLLLLFVQALLPAALVYLSRLLVDGLVATIGRGWSWESAWPAVYPAILIAGTVALIELAQGFGGWIRAAQAELVRDHLSATIHEKAVAVDLAFYESSEYHDNLERVHNDLSSRPLALLESIGNFLQNSITLLAMATLLLPYGVWLPCLLFISTVPAFYVILHCNRRYHRWWEQTTPDRRRAQYYDMLLTHSGIAAEVRAFDLGPYFQSTYQTLRRRMRAERLRLTRDQNLARLGASIVGMLTSGSALAWMFWSALQGRATLGDLTLFYQAFQRGQGLLHSLLDNVGQIYANTLFLGNLFEFLQLPSHVKDPLCPVVPQPILKEGICFQQVVFRYPRSECQVLQDFNLTIPAGQIVAIVGANGVGKSTLLKLLCRFYDPEAGLITVDGTDIRKITLKHLRRMMTVLFQWPVPYQATAAQNIAFGDLSTTQDGIDLETAARSAGAHDIISRLPQRYNTLLGKWFSNGVELSIGEWQRIALSRAFFRQAPILILDEPTSALDSWAEADWFDRFRALANGRTAIIITHRFTIARRADMIHVMDAGRIVESGKHNDLLAQGGLYAQSWASQIQGQSVSTEKPFVPTRHAGSPVNSASCLEL